MALVVATAMIAAWLVAGTAYAGTASTGKLAFHPCTKCHPVAVDASGRPMGPLPNGFKKHEIVLEAHDILGRDERACLVCHDSPQRNPGKLVLPDGSLVDITGDVSRVCQRCHFEKYQDWLVGIHGKREPKCTAAGCHNPHTPGWIHVAALPPFQGTGMEVKAVGDREPFKPFASPPVDPPVETPVSIWVVTALGVVLSAALLGYLLTGRTQR